MDLSKLRAVFIRESESSFLRLEQALLEVKKNPADPAALKTIFRVMHSLQGTAAMMRLAKMTQLALGLEEALAPFQDGKGRLGEDWIDFLPKTLDALRRLLKEFQEGADMGVDIQPLLNKLKAIACASDRPPLDKM